jgi:ribosomal protein S18 acetylase RimI-like enzyme
MAPFLDTNIKFIKLRKRHLNKFKEAHKTCLPFAKYSERTYEQFLSGEIFETYGFINEGNQMLSFIVVMIDSGVCDIISIGTVEEYRRCGLATKMLDMCVGAYELKYIFLEVQNNNLAAIGFYINYGFEIIGARRESNWGQDSLLMKKSALI